MTPAAAIAAVPWWTVAKGIMILGIVGAGAWGNRRT